MGVGAAERCSQAWVGAVSPGPQGVPRLQAPGLGGQLPSQEGLAKASWREQVSLQVGWAEGVLGSKQGRCKGPMGAGGGGRRWERRQCHVREGLGYPAGEFWFTQKLFGLLFILKAPLKKKKISGLRRSGREPASQCRRCGFNPWSGKIPDATWQLSLCPQFLSLCSAGKRGLCREKPASRERPGTEQRPSTARNK